MHILNEDAIEYAANNLFTSELGYAEIIWGPSIAPEGAREQEREFTRYDEIQALHTEDVPPKDWEERARIGFRKET